MNFASEIFLPFPLLLLHSSRQPHNYYQNHHQKSFEIGPTLLYIYIVVLTFILVTGMAQNNSIQLSNLDTPLSTTSPMPDCSNPPKWIIPSTSNLDIKRFLCHKFLQVYSNRTPEEAWAKVYIFEGDGETVFAMLEEDWSQ